MPRNSIMQIPFFFRWRRPGWLFLVVVSLLCFVDALPAQSMLGLYQAQVPVAGQEAEQRNQAIQDAFVKVLVKVTGNRRIVSRGNLNETVANASRFVQEYSYHIESEQERYLDVIFDAQAVNRLLRSQRLPVWAEDNRPGILVWMAIEQRGKRRLLVPDRDAPVLAAIDAEAQERGLPLLLPLMDLEDQGRLQVADLWGDFEVNIRAASRRYSPDMIFTGRLVREKKGAWRGDWKLYQERSNNDWNNRGKSLEAVAADAVRHVADLLANRFAPLARETGLNLVRLRVSGIDTLAGYATVGRLLEGHKGLERVTVAAVEADAVVYELQTRSGIDALEQGLSVGGVLEPDAGIGLGFESPDGVDPVSSDADLYYRVR